MKRNQLLIGVVTALSLFVMTGCTTLNKNNKAGSNNTSKTEEESKLKAKCSAVECMKQIELTSTIEQINEITGVEGVLTDEVKKIYEYDLGNKEKITLEYGSKEIPTIKAEFTRSTVADKKVDLSKVEDLKIKVKAGLTYDQFKAEIGDVDGVIVEKSSTSTKYMWVSKNGGYIRGSFRNSDNKCAFFTGMTDRK